MELLVLGYSPRLPYDAFPRFIDPNFKFVLFLKLQIYLFVAYFATSLLLFDSSILPQLQVFQENAIKYVMGQFIHEQLLRNRIKRDEFCGVIQNYKASYWLGFPL